MTQLIEALRITATKWRASNPEYRGGVVLVWDDEVYGWKNDLREPEGERPGAYAVDKAGLVFKAEGGDDDNGAKAWVAVDPDAKQETRRDLHRSFKAGRNQSREAQGVPEQEWTYSVGDLLQAVANYVKWRKLRGIPQLQMVLLHLCLTLPFHTLGDAS